MKISQCLLNIFTNDVDIYWLSKGFYNTVIHFYESIPNIVEAAKLLLEKEDKTLHRHLNEIEGFDKLCLRQWFVCLFAGALHDAALIKIWDKVVGKTLLATFFVSTNQIFYIYFNKMNLWKFVFITGGSFKILAFLIVVILMTFRRNLLNSDSIEFFLEELKNISEETSEVIANKAAELWQQYGSPLVIGDVRKDKNDMTHDMSCTDNLKLLLK